MPTTLRKIRKMRGSRTMGWGRVGQHRARGKKGHRKAGRHKAGWSWVVKYEPNYYGKKGFTSPKSLRREGNIINVAELEEISGRLQVENKNGKPFIDLTTMGYSKLLGSGKISASLVVRVSSCSKVADEKVKKAGGQVITLSQEPGE